MAVKPRLDLEARKAASEFLDRNLRRIYLIWVIGIAVGAIEIRLDKVSYAGISFSLDSVEKLQGLIYCVCILVYLAMAGMAIVMSLQFISVEKDMLRQSVYRALDGKKTLLGLSKSQHDLLRAKALTYLIATRIVIIIAACMPLAHIILLQQPALLSGLDLIFHTHSLTADRKIDLNSLSLFGVTVVLLLIWTMLMNYFFGRVYEGFWTTVMSISILACGTYALMESYARNIPFNEAVGRTLAAQLVIYSLWVAPKVLLAPFMLWLDAKLAYYRFKARRKNSKQV